MIGNAPVSPITKIPGWLTDIEERHLIHCAKQVKKRGIIFEIGSEYGRSAGAFRSGADDSIEIHCIDIDKRAIYNWTPNNLTEAGLFVNVYLHHADSRNFDKSGILDSKIDLLFIDGNHHYDYVLADLQNFVPDVATGGYILLHDVAQETNPQPHSQHIEVRKALDTFLKNWSDPFTKLEHIISADSLLGFQVVPVKVITNE